MAKAKQQQTLGEIDRKLVLLQIKKKSLESGKELRELKKERAKQVRSKSNGK